MEVDNLKQEQQGEVKLIKTHILWHQSNKKEGYGESQKGLWRKGYEKEQVSHEKIGTGIGRDRAQRLPWQRGRTRKVELFLPLELVTTRSSTKLIQSNKNRIFVYSTIFSSLHTSRKLKNRKKKKSELTDPFFSFSERERESGSWGGAERLRFCLVCIV